MFKEVEQFNKEIIGINRKPGTIEDDTEFLWLVGVILEELDELKTAHEQKDFIGEIDALMDLMYFAAGALTRMGIDSSVLNEIFRAIHGCNMEKKKGQKKGRLFFHDLDATKPPGWMGPEDHIIAILSHNYGVVA